MGLRERETDALARTLERGLLNRTVVTRLEDRLERSLSYGAPVHAVGVSSGTSALVASLLAVRASSVAIPAYGFWAAAAAARALGIRSEFVDVDPRTGLVDLDALEKVSGRVDTAVIIDLDGNLPDWGEVRDLANRRGLRLIEDACPAFCSTWETLPAGTFGDVGVFSFHETKILGAGEGGALVTSDADLADRAMVARELGERWDATEAQRNPVSVGLNLRMHPLAAALLLDRMIELGPKVERARDTYDRIWEALDGSPLSLPERHGGVTIVPHKIRILASHAIPACWEPRDGIPLRADGLIPTAETWAFWTIGRGGWFPGAREFYERSLILGDRERTPWSVTGKELRKWTGALSGTRERSEA